MTIFRGVAVEVSRRGLTAAAPRMCRARARSIEAISLPAVGCEIGHPSTLGYGRGERTRGSKSWLCIMHPIITIAASEGSLEGPVANFFRPVCELRGNTARPHLRL